MRTRTRVLPTLAVLIAGGLLLACSGPPSADEVLSEVQKAPAAPAPTVAPLPEAPPPTPGPDPAELAAKEAELAARQRELEARESEVRRRELAAREAAVAEQERRLAEERSREVTPPPEETPSGVETASVPAEDPDWGAGWRDRAEGSEEEVAEAAPPPPVQHRYTVPAGTSFSVELLDPLSSERSRQGDTFRARLVEDLAVGGQVMAAAGSEVLGLVEEAVPLDKRVGGQAKLRLRFTDLVPQGGGMTAIEAEIEDLGKKESKRDAAAIGGATAGGALLGRILSDKHKGRGTVIGAILGAAAGTAIASRTRDVVELPEGTVLDLRLEKDAVVVR